MKTITSPRTRAAQLEQLRGGPRDAHAVDELVDEDVVADLERRVHRRRWDLNASITNARSASSNQDPRRRIDST